MTSNTSFVDILKENNIKILSKISQIEQSIIAQRKMQKGLSSQESKTPDSLEVFDDNSKLTKISKTLLTIYMKNCLNIYKYEFPNLVDEAKEIRLDKATVSETNSFDCYGLPSGVQVSNSAQEIFNIISSNNPELSNHPFAKVMEQLGYKLENNQIRFVHGKQNGIEKRGQFESASLGAKSSKTRLFDIDNEQVENSLNYNDFWAYIAAKGEGYSDLSWFIDLMPHEAMHVFGSRGDGLFEGATEDFSREMASKYGLRLTPTSHANETILWQKLEKILGRDFLAHIDLDLEFDKINDEYKKAKSNKTLTPELKSKRENLEEQHINLIATKLDEQIQSYFPDKIDDYRETLKFTISESKRMLMSRISNNLKDNPEKLSKELMTLESQFEKLDFENQLTRNILEVNEILYQSVTKMKLDLGFIEDVYGPIINGTKIDGKDVGLTKILDDLINEKEKDGTIYTLGEDDSSLTPEEKERKNQYGKEAIDYQNQSIKSLDHFLDMIPPHLKNSIDKDSKDETSLTDSFLSGQDIGFFLIDEIRDVEKREKTSKAINSQTKDLESNIEGHVFND